jgi:hypothetical protein
VKDFRENIAEYATELGRDIERRQAAVLRALGGAETSQCTPRERAALYESTPYTDPDSGAQCVGIGSLLLHDELSGYLHPQPGSGLLMYGTRVYLFYPLLLTLAGLENCSFAHNWL